MDLQPAIQEVQGRLLGAEKGQAHPSQEMGARVGLRADQGRRGGDYSGILGILGRMKAQGVLSVGEGSRSGGEPRVRKGSVQGSGFSGWGGPRWKGGPKHQWGSHQDAGLCL